MAEGIVEMHAVSADKTYLGFGKVLVPEAGFVEFTLWIVVPIGHNTAKSFDIIFEEDVI